MKNNNFNCLMITKISLNVVFTIFFIYLFLSCASDKKKPKVGNIPFIEASFSDNHSQYQAYIDRKNKLMSNNLGVSIKNTFKIQNSYLINMQGSNPVNLFYGYCDGLETLSDFYSSKEFIDLKKQYQDAEKRDAIFVGKKNIPDDSIINFNYFAIEIVFYNQEKNYKDFLKAFNTTKYNIKLITQLDSIKSSIGLKPDLINLWGFKNKREFDNFQDDLKNNSLGIDYNIYIKKGAWNFGIIPNKLKMQ